MNSHRYKAAILPLLAWVAAACGTGTATNQSGTSSGAPVQQSGASSSGLGPTGSGVSSMVVGGSGAASGAVEAAASGTEGSMIPDATASSSGGNKEAGALPDTGGDATDATTAIAQGPCNGNTLKPGNTTVMIQSGGQARSYILHVPPKYDGTTRLPLVVDMHGKGGDAQGQMSGSGWLAKADAVGIVMIYPQGLYASWNAGPAGCPILMCCCEPAQDYSIDDAGFIRAAVTKTEQDGCIDITRIYATGLSNGGCMSHWLGCDAADMFAAIAPVSCANMIACTPSRPISVVEFRGKQDTDVMYDGGAIGPTTHDWPSAAADFTKWSGLDMCTDMPMTMPMYPICQQRTQCAGGAEVDLCSPNCGHVLYACTAQAMAAVPDVAWEVFQRHTLP
jgi:polyhydroxybutyrate depolymerase